MFVNGGELDRAEREFERLANFDGDELDGQTLTQVRADGFAGVSEVARYRNEFERARENAEAALARFERIDDDVGRSDVLNALGAIEVQTGTPESAKEYYEQALELRRAVGDRTKIASTLANLGQVERSLGEYDVAREYAHTSLRIRRELQYRWGEALSLDLLSHIELEDGVLEDAERYIRLSLDIRLDIGDELGSALSSNNLARIEHERGALEAARERYEELVDSLEGGQFTRIRQGAHHGLSAVLLELSEPESAVEHADVAIDLLEENESKLVDLQATRARALLDCGSLSDALELAEEVLDDAASLGREPNAHGHVAYGLALVEDGAVADGLDHLETAVELAPSSALEGRYLCELADALESVDRPADALDKLERAVEQFSAVDAGVRARKTALQALELAEEIDDEPSVDVEAYLD
ncbi:hypothetical protein AUR66_06595 [Haloferax profundi]|uniref:Tetratricopeptide repeat protein n=2 Tax=Haloferax profundi TaxID=1544718 RepID=A0A0W1SW68_9EURY|nr:hypothetical protein AUR66_06595 [Haloferax profundi]